MEHINAMIIQAAKHMLIKNYPWTFLNGFSIINVTS